MGDPKGFLKYAREGPKRKPVELRVLDWKEMYEPIAEDKLKVQGKTIIMVEHRLRELFRIADRVLVMNFGRKIAEGEPKEVMEQPEVKSAYLGSEEEGS